jgi:hypothetical protein
LHRHLLDPWQDWRLGIDASGRHWPSELSLQGANAEQASEYIGTPTWVLSRALDRLGINPRDFVFVDLGSGKGRVILRAGARPFRRVEGVEFSAFSPFGKKVMQQFADRLVASLRAPRDCYFIHLNPQHPECLGDAFEPMAPSPRQATLDRLISPWPLRIYRYREAFGGAAA